MSKKVISRVCAGLAGMSVVISANAALIDNGSFTTDSISGLDWLDLSVTQNQSYDAAPGRNAGWRYATNSEIEGLFSVAFDGYTDTNAFRHYSDSNVTGSYADQTEDVQLFASLFGSSSVSNTLDSTLGFYRDESNILRQMGVNQYSSYSRVFSDENTNNWNGYEGLGVYGNGIYLVRESISAVPVPAAVWLFGSGLIGLVGVSRRRV
ncbi:MAG: VPLPA-CTERM sorting domain-containing protein [Gammaproteobacteria bacterium]|nr:VPLPA-CTERM sorting domain-containing protein [Gammaproteobacteria bacterium]